MRRLAIALIRHMGLPHMEGTMAQPMEPTMDIDSVELIGKQPFLLPGFAPGSEEFDDLYTVFS